MRRIAYLGFVIALFPAASLAEATSTAQTITYAPNTELSCPANSILGGRKCYCNAGYKVSGSSCVKDEPAAPTQNEIYQDVAAAVAFNTELTCTQLGFFTTVDMDMCQKYKANRYGSWKFIQRPSTAPPLVTNPWAQPGQQTLNIDIGSSTQSIPAIETTLPPPPTPTTTPETAKVVTTEEPVPVQPEPKPVEKPAAKEIATPDPVAETTSTPTEKLEASSSPETELENAIAAKDLVKMSSILAQLAAASEAVAPPPPPPPEPTPIPHEDIKFKETNSVPEPPKSFFKKVIDWIFSII